MTLPEGVGLTVRARCPDCDGAVSMFHFQDPSREFGFVLKDGTHEYQGVRYARTQYRLLRCSGCGRAGIATFHDNGREPHVLEEFYPHAIEMAAVPRGVPDGVVKEYREAEKCVAARAYRAASALVRSTLEKTLKANGFTSGSLSAKIDAAAADGVITEARKQRAHDNIRVLGNDVVHDDWREVTEEEAVASLHYAQRVLEDLYDDRATVESLLIAKNLLASAGPP